MEEPPLQQPELQPQEGVGAVGAGVGGAAAAEGMMIGVAFAVAEPPLLPHEEVEPVLWDPSSTIDFRTDRSLSSSVAPF